MKHVMQIKGLPLAVTAYAAWKSSHLLKTWFHSPFDRLGWVSFLIWTIPVVYFLKKQICRKDYSLILTALGLILLLAGDLLELNALRYWGMASTLAAFTPQSIMRIIWLMGAVSWMPALGWLMHDFQIQFVTTIRILLALSTSIPWLFYRKNDQDA